MLSIHWPKGRVAGKKAGDGTFSQYRDFPLRNSVSLQVFMMPACQVQWSLYLGIVHVRFPELPRHCHTLGGFLQKRTLSRFWKLEVSSETSAGPCSLKTPSLPLPACRPALPFLSLCLLCSILCLCCHMTLSLGLSPNLPLFRTPVIGLMAHPNPV